MRQNTNPFKMLATNIIFYLVYRKDSAAAYTCTPTSIIKRKRTYGVWITIKKKRKKRRDTDALNTVTV